METNILKIVINKHCQKKLGKNGHRHLIIGILQTFLTSYNN